MVEAVSCCGESSFMQKQITCLELLYGAEYNRTLDDDLLEAAKDFRPRVKIIPPVKHHP